MSRFFVRDVNLSSGIILIFDEDVKHIKNVLRKNPGDRIFVSDGEGTDHLVEILKLESDCITTKIIQSWVNNTESPVKITLFQGIPKSDKMDLIVQKSVELGVVKIVPVMTERTIVKMGNVKDWMKKVERWQKIATEAAKQCNRGILPKVENVISFSEAIQYTVENDLNLVPYEKETGNGLRNTLMNHKPEKVGIFIGPEGGFTEDEIGSAADCSIKPVTLGPRILRTETAGIAAISIIMYEYGDMA